MTKVSFIIPVYNVQENMLQKCVNSVLGQSDQSLEIILVDDGSDDNTARLCDDLQKIDKRIKVIHQINKGLSAARNTGVRAAEASFITFLDGDDFVESDFIEKLFPTNDNIQVVIGKMIRNAGKKEINNKYPFFDGECWRYCDRAKLLAYVIRFDSNIYDACGKLIKRELLISENIQHNERIRQGAEGLEFNVRLFQKTTMVIFRDEYVYHYVENRSSITHTPSFENDKLMIQCFESIKKTIIDAKDLSEKEKKNILQEINNRMLFVICGVFVSSIYHPSNGINNDQRKQNIQYFLGRKIVNDAIKDGDSTGIGTIRSFVVKCLKTKRLWPIRLIGFGKFLWDFA